MIKLILKAQNGFKSKYKKESTTKKHNLDWWKDNIYEFLSIIPKKGNRRGRRTFEQENIGKTDTDACAAWSNNILRNKGYKTIGDAWNLNNIKLYLSGYTNKFPDTDDFQKMNEYNWDAADNIKKNLDINKLNKKQIYVTNLYSTGSPYQREAFYNGTSEHGSHTGQLKYVDGKWYLYHNWHKTIKRTPIKNVLGSDNEIGITSIFVPTKKIGGKIYANNNFNFVPFEFYKYRI